jgi:hypothetical protein
VAKIAHYKTLIEPELKRKLDAALARRRSTLTGFTEAIVSWFIEQDPLVQSLILGQIEPQDQQQIVRLVLQKLEKGGRGSRGG